MTVHVALSIVSSIAVALWLVTRVAAWLGKMGYVVPSEHGRVGDIDGLRGYLALCTLCHHFVIWLQITEFHGSWSAPAINLFNQLGTGSVSLFFMITGILFYPKILRGVAVRDWLRMMTGRVFRIMPLLLFSVLLIVFIIALRTRHAPGAGDIHALVAWISTWGEPVLMGYADSGRVNAFVLWSLWYEWVFYIALFPLCAVAADLCRKYALPTWLIPLALILVSVAARLSGVEARLFLFIPLFACGMLAHEVRLRPGLTLFFERASTRLLAIAGLVFALFAFPTPYAGAVPFFCFFFISVACGNDVFGLLRKKAALVLGVCSFGVYLLHGIFLNLYFVDVRDRLGAVDLKTACLIFPLIAVFVVAFASITYLLIENPGIALGKQITRRFSLPFSKLRSPDSGDQAMSRAGTVTSRVIE